MATTPKKHKGPKVRHVPARTCVACRQVRPKRELIRVVRTPEGHVELDATGKKSGRGAYLCAKRSCWEPALRKGRLEHELETTLLPEDRAALEAFVETLPAESTAPASGAATGRTRKAPVRPVAEQPEQPPATAGGAS
ncbi:MAG: RNase P modulator RnpM [Ktedonobacterales bacterium]